jgi:hypothetical protein
MATDFEIQQHARAFYEQRYKQLLVEFERYSKVHDLASQNLDTKKLFVLSVIIEAIRVGMELGKCETLQAMFTNIELKPTDVKKSPK